MKKIVSLFISVVIMMLTAVTASAASVAKFNITLVSETDKQAVVSIDFNGGTGFSGFDFDVQLDSKRVEVVSAEKGNGFLNFQKQATVAIAEINPKSEPVKATMAVMPAYRNIDSKDLFVITLKKLSKEPLTNDDFRIIITNCVDASLQSVETSLTTDLQGVAQEGTSASSAVAPSDTTEASTDASVSTDVPELTNAVDGTSGEVIDDVPDITDETAQDENGEENNSTKTVIIAVVAVVFVAAVAAVTVIVIKKKKSPDNGNEE